MRLNKVTVVKHAALKIPGAVKWPDNAQMDVSVARHLPGIAALCEQYGVAHLELFGSSTGPEFNPESSDLDFLVELDMKSPGSLARRWTDLAEALEKLFGRHVDLVNPRYIRNPYFLQAVNNSRTVVYDRQNAQCRMTWTH